MKEPLPGEKVKWKNRGKVWEGRVSGDPAGSAISRDEAIHIADSRGKAHWAPLSRMKWNDGYWDYALYEGHIQ